MPIVSRLPQPAEFPSHQALTLDDGLALAPAIKIGELVIDPPLFQAPMAGFTNYAFRQIVREFGGAGLLATEMVSAKGFVWQDRIAQEHPDRLWGVKDEPRPLAVQMWDNDPETLAAVGARLAHEYKVSVVDLNFGCPVKVVTEKAHSGSYLLRDPQRMGAIIERVVKACHPTPVTAKMRLGCTRDKINAIETAQVVEAAGAAALTVHGRVAEDFFRGRADWALISEIKPYLKKIPLIGNGDLQTAEEVVEAFRRYDVDGVMIARAALGKPWLFAQAASALRGKKVLEDLSLEQERDLLLHHFSLVCQRFGETRGVLLMRKFACCYAQGRPRARKFRSLVAEVSTREEFLRAVHEGFPRSEWLPPELPSYGDPHKGAGAE